MRNSLESWQLLLSAVGEMGHCNPPNSHHLLGFGRGKNVVSCIFGCCVC